MDLNYKTTNLFPVCLHSVIVDDFDQLQTTLIKESYDLKKDTFSGFKL